jgi:hypothetical protein
MEVIMTATISGSAEAAFAEFDKRIADKKSEFVAAEQQSLASKQRLADNLKIEAVSQNTMLALRAQEEAVQTDLAAARKEATAIRSKAQGDADRILAEAYQKEAAFIGELQNALNEIATKITRRKK